MRRRTSCAAAAGLLAWLGLVAAPAGAVVVLDHGHVDYGARMIGGELQSQIKDGTGSSVIWREPAEVLFELGPEARTTIPQGSKMGFLGPPGTNLWMIPQVQRPGVLWAGWNTEEISGAQVSGSVVWQLAAVEGPGRVAVFQTGAFGSPDVLFDSADGLPDARAIPLGTHAHGNWAFTHPGDYRLTFTMSAERAGGGLTSDTEALAVRVDGDSGSEPGPVEGSGGGGGSGAGGEPAEGGAAKPRMRVAAPRLRGRVLALTVGLSAPGHVAVAVRRAGRTVARPRPRGRRVGARGQRLRFRLAKRLAPGDYKVVVTARIGSTTLRRPIALPVRKPG